MISAQVYEDKNKIPAKEYILLAEDDVDDVEFLMSSLQNLDQVPKVHVISSAEFRHRFNQDVVVRLSSVLRSLILISRYFQICFPVFENIDIAER